MRTTSLILIGLLTSNLAEAAITHKYNIYHNRMDDYALVTDSPESGTAPYHLATNLQDAGGLYASYASVDTDHGNLRVQMNVNPVTSNIADFPPNFYAGSTANFKTTDLLFSSLANDPIDVTLYLDMIGQLDAVGGYGFDGDFIGVTSELNLTAKVGGNSHVANAYESNSPSSPPPANTGVLAGIGASFAETVGIALYDVPVNQMTNLQLIITVDGGIANRGTSLSGGFFEVGLHSGGLVFDLPEGVEVNAPGAQIVDNEFLGDPVFEEGSTPVPTSLMLLLGAGIVARRRLALRV